MPLTSAAQYYYLIKNIKALHVGAQRFLARIDVALQEGNYKPRKQARKCKRPRKAPGHVPCISRFIPDDMQGARKKQKVEKVTIKKEPTS